MTPLTRLDFKGSLLCHFQLNPRDRQKANPIPGGTLLLNILGASVEQENRSVVVMSPGSG